jgi:hypothetical protein
MPSVAAIVCLCNLRNRAQGIEANASVTGEICSSSLYGVCSEGYSRQCPRRRSLFSRTQENAEWRCGGGIRGSREWLIVQAYRLAQTAAAGFGPPRSARKERRGAAAASSILRV